jgi:hypothetical protein
MVVEGELAPGDEIITGLATVRNEFSGRLPGGGGGGRF